MMKKRVVLLLMTVCMLIGVLPAMSVTASAADHTGHTAANWYLWWGIATDGSDQVLHIANSSSTNTPNKVSTNETTPAWSSYSGTITRVVVDNEVRPRLTKEWFKNCSNVISMDLANLDTCCVEYTTSMFEGCSSLTSLNVSNFNTSNVKHMTSMFEGCSRLTSLDVSKFNTSNVTDIGWMFQGCSSLKTINLSAWNQNGSNTKKVTGLYKTFQGCSSLQTINLAGFDTSSLTTMEYAFDGCSSLQSIDLTGFRASSVNFMEYTFRNTSALETLDLSSFDVSSVNRTTSFLENSGVKVLNLGNFNLPYSRNTDYAFSGVKLKELTVHGVMYNATNAAISAEISTVSGGNYVKVSAAAPVTITSLTTMPNRVTSITGTQSITGKRKNIISVPAGDTITMAGGAGYTPSGAAVEVDVSTGSISSIPDGTTVKVTNPNSASASDYPDGYWIAGNYTYNTNGGTFAADPFAVLYPNQAFTLPTNITRTGYTFAGWYDNSGLTGSPVATIAAGSTGSKKFWAKWTPITYQITYTLNGGTVTSANPTDYTIETAAITLKNPTRTGYTFTGWSGTGLSGSTNTSVTIPASSTGNRSYTANWTVNQYTITFESNGGSTITPITQNYGTAVTAPTPTKTGYTLNGWSPALPAKMPANNMTVTAQWKPNTYTVSFHANGGACTTSSKSVTYDGTYGDLPTATRTGYTFGGWYTEASAGTEVESTTPVKITGTQTLYAKWTPLAAAAPGVTTGGNLALTYGYSEGSISVTAAPIEGHAFTYQWYSNHTNSNTSGSAITGATGSSYAIPLGKSAGTTEYYYCVVTATREDNGQTKTAASDVITVTVDKATMTDITITPYSGTYDGSAHGITVTKPEGATVKYGTGADNCTQDSLTYTNAGSYTVYYKVSKANYNDFTGSATVNITKATPNVTKWPTVNGTVYVNGTASLNSDGTIENSVAGNFVLAQTSWTSAGVQTTTITFNPTDSTNYNAVQKNDFTVTVEKRTVASAAAQTSITNKVYGTAQAALGLPATVSITAGGKNFTVPVTWSGYNPNTLDPQTLTGTLDLTAIDAEVAQPDPAITAAISVTLQPRTAGSYTYQPKSALYSGSPISHEIPAQDGVASISYSYVGTGGTVYGPSATAPTNAGSYQVTATFTMAAGYAQVAPKTAALTITKAEVAEPTISGTYTYNGEEQTVTLAGVESYMTVSNNTATNAGDYTVTVTLDGNHQWAAGSDGSITWTIAKATMTGITVTPYSGTYDGSAHGITVTKPEGATVKYGTSAENCTQESLTYTDFTDGEKTVYYKVSKANYNDFTGYATVNITKAPGRITTPPRAVENLTYDSNEHELVTAGSGTGGTIQYKLDGGSYGATIPKAANAGTYTVYYKLVGDTNHTDVAEAHFDVIIGAADMTGITDNGYSGTYDGSAHGITVNIPAVYDGAIVGYGTTEGSYTLSSSPSYTDFTNGAKTVYYKVSKANYNDVFGSATVNITKAAPTVTWPTVSGTVYVNAPAVSLTGGSATGIGSAGLTGGFALDTIDLTSSGEKTVSIIFNPDSTNYSAMQKNNFTVTVVKRTVSSVAAQTPITNKTYGTAQEALGLPGTVSITTADGKTFNSVPVTWSGYSANTLTGQTLTGTLDLTAIAAEVEQPPTPVTATISVTLQPRTAGAYTYQPKIATYTGSPISNEISLGDLDGVTSIAYSYVGISGTSYGPSATAPTDAGTYEVTATFTMEYGYAPVTPKTAALTINKAEVAVPTVSGTYTYNGETHNVTLADFDENCMTVSSGDTATNAGDYTVTVNLDGNHKWPDGSDGSIAWSIGQAPVTVKAKDQSIYIGQGVPDLSAPVLDTHYTVTGLFGSDSLDLTGIAMAYGEPPVNTAAGAYTITVAGAIDASSNYAITYDTGTLTISALPAIYIPPAYKVENVASEDADGSVSFSSGSARMGDKVTVTVTPDRYYKVSGLTVKDSSGKEIAVTDNGDGTFTFKMPGSKVTVEPAFSWDNPFTDVKENAFYASAVEWALKNDIDNGTGDGTTFSPNDTCTRAQAVTLLWRAAGCPEPESSVNPFTDMEEDASYAKAVLWAFENGIIKGTGDGTTFSPDNVCDRAQLVTLLWRAEKSPVVGTANVFTDVAPNAYYAGATNWAVENGITKGTGDGTTFSPTNDCDRAQIVTFLYRFFVK